MRWPWRSAVPPELSRQLEADEMITAVTTADDGRQLLTTRRGLWTITGSEPQRLGWERVAKAKLDAGVLTVVPVEAVAIWTDGTVVVRDGTPIEYRLDRPAKVTDQVHARVRRSVAASRHLPWPRSGGWVALRRVPGLDGLLTQVRLDPGADPDAPGFAAAVLQVADELRGTRPIGVTGADE